MCLVSFYMQAVKIHAVYMFSMGTRVACAANFAAVCAACCVVTKKYVGSLYLLLLLFFQVLALAASYLWFVAVQQCGKCGSVSMDEGRAVFFPR